MKHIAQIQIEFLKIASLEKDLDQLETDSRKSVFLGGEIDEGNKWRKQVKHKFGDKFKFLDPYDTDWDPADNIYDELTGLSLTDEIVFLNGGEFTEKEKQFLKDTGKDFKSFTTVEELENYLSKR
jgi:hypothetical protein